MLYLATCPTGTPVMQREVADILIVPVHFLGKVLQTLAKHRLVVSQKGKSGGFALARAPELISLMEVVTAIDGPAVLDDCIMGFPNCSDEHPCPLHADWTKRKKAIRKMLASRNLAQLSKELKPKLTAMHGGSFDNESK